MTETRPRLGATAGLLGPAFVAALAYVDPGNIGANLTAGRDYRFLLVWVLVVASGMAAICQYQSAKVGLVTGRSLTRLVTERISGRGRRGWTLAYGGQAVVIAMATDLAEVVGGALGLALLFGTPLWLGGLVVGGVTVLLLRYLRRRGEKVFEAVVAAILGVVVLGFFGALGWSPPNPGDAAAGLVPYVPDAAAWPLIAAMLGATVMPHAIYVHSALAIDRHRPDGKLLQPLPRLLRVQKADVGLALLVAGSVNVAMLLLGATLLQETTGDTVETAHATLAATLGPLPAAVFGIGLLASGIGSAVVGTHAGAGILGELVNRRLSPTVRRSLTLVPAVLVLLAGVPPTEILVWSQIVLSFGIALAIVPLALLTGDRRLMGAYVDRRFIRVVNWTLVTAVVALNVVTIWATVGPQPS